MCLTQRLHKRDRIFGKKLEGLYDLPDEEAKKKKFAGGTTLWYFKEAGRKTAADWLLESDKPALILQGGMDFQVLPDVDYARFQELLRGRENTLSSGVVTSGTEESIE